MIKTFAKKAIATGLLLTTLAAPLSSQSGKNGEADVGNSSAYDREMASPEEQRQKALWGEGYNVIRPVGPEGLPGIEMITSTDSKNVEVATTRDGFVVEFDYTNSAGEIINTYEVLRSGDELTVKEKGKNVIVGTMNYWDIDQDGERGNVEERSRKKGYNTDFTPAFTDALYSALLKAHDSSLEVQKTKTLEEIAALNNILNSKLIAKDKELEDLSSVYDSKISDLEVQSMTDVLNLRDSYEAKLDAADEKSKGLEGAVNYPNTSLLVGGFGGSDSKRGTFGGIEAGVGVDFSKYFGANVLGRFAFGEDGKVLEELTTVESASGVYGKGTEVQEGYNMPGLALDLKVGARGFYGSVGAGLTFENSNDKTTESMMRGEDVLKSNEIYSQDSALSPELRLGAGYTGASGLGVSANYSTNFEGRQSGGLNVTIPFGRTKQEKELVGKK